VATETLRPTAHTDHTARTVDEANAYNGNEANNSTTSAKDGVEFTLHTWTAKSQTHSATVLKYVWAADDANDQSAEFQIEFTEDAWANTIVLVAWSWAAQVKTTGSYTCTTNFDTSLAEFRVQARYSEGGADYMVVELYDVRIEGEYAAATPVSISDGVVVSDAFSGVQTTRQAHLSDGAVLSDAFSGVQTTRQAHLSDGVIVSDGFGSQGPVTVSDGVVASDAFAVVKRMTVNIADGVLASDAFGAVRPVGFSDGVVSGDTFGAKRAVSLSDGVTVGDLYHGGVLLPTYLVPARLVNWEYTGGIVTVVLDGAVYTRTSLERLRFAPEQVIRQGLYILVGRGDADTISALFNTPQDTVTLTWTHEADTVFEIYRKTDGDYSEIDAVRSGSYTDGPLTDDTYTYRVLPVDDEGDYAPVDSTIVITNLTRNEDAYIYKDYTADYFTDFTHYFQAKWSQDSATCRVGTWGVSQVVDELVGLWGGFEKAVFSLFEGTTTVWFQESENRGNDRYEALSESTDYYFTVTKTGTTVQLKVYDDAARTNLLDTMTVVLGTDRAYRYVFGCNTWNSSSAAAGDGEVTRLDLDGLGNWEDFTTYTELDPNSHLAVTRTDQTEVTISSTPEPPTSLAVSMVGVTLTLTWTASTSADIQDYRVYSSDGESKLLLSADSVVATVNHPTVTWQKDMTGLTGTYIFLVRARDTDGNVEGNIDQAVTIHTVSGAEQAAPNNPQFVTADSAGGGKVTVGFTYIPHSGYVAKEARVYYDNGTGTVDYTSVVGTVAMNNPTDIDRYSWTSAALVDETEYRFVVRIATDNDPGGIETTNVDEHTATPNSDAPDSITLSGEVV